VNDLDSTLISFCDEATRLKVKPTGSHVSAKKMCDKIKTSYRAIIAGHNISTGR